jgi:hypothetical protein
MKQESQRTKYFAEEAPLPMHMMMMEEMPMDKYVNRFRKSAAARSDHYECFTFYKRISRPLPLGRMEAEPDDEKR